MSTSVTDNSAEQRYEIHADGELVALAEYRLHGDVADFVHTETLPGHEGKGFAGRLVGGALDDARRRRWKVRPLCPYVASYIERHPEHMDLVPFDERARFFPTDGH